jgi:transposase
MYVATLLADPTCLRLERVLSSTALITLVVRTTATSVACPRCSTASRRVHSHYVRTVADLPWHGVSVRLELHARKFFCPSDECAFFRLKTIFRDRLRARRTDTQATETRMRCVALNRMTSLGMPESYAV